MKFRKWYCFSLLRDNVTHSVPEDPYHHQCRVRSKAQEQKFLESTGFTPMERLSPIEAVVYWLSSGCAFEI